MSIVLLTMHVPMSKVERRAGPVEYSGVAKNTDLCWYQSPSMHKNRRNYRSGVTHCTLETKIPRRLFETNEMGNGSEWAIIVKEELPDNDLGNDNLLAQLVYAQETISCKCASGIRETKWKIAKKKIFPLCKFEWLPIYYKAHCAITNAEIGERKIRPKSFKFLHLSALSAIKRTYWTTTNLNSDIVRRSHN